MSYFSNYQTGLTDIYNKEDELDDNINTFNIENSDKDELKQANHNMYIEQKKVTSSLMRGAENHLYYLNELNDHNSSDKANIEDGISDMEKVEEQKEIQKKINEINVYYEKKRHHQMVIFKNVSYILTVLILISILYHSGMIPEMVFIGSIGFGMACLVIYLGKESMDMMFRNNIKYDEYDSSRSGRSSTPKSNNSSSDKNRSEQNESPLHGQKDLISKDCYLSTTTTTST